MALFERISRYRTGLNLPPDRVQATYLWLVEGGVFIGEIAIRHRLNDALTRYGGHIGYGVRFSAWNKGVGTKMLAMALEYIKEEIGLDEVLITCDDENCGSARVIEKNGGVLHDRVLNSIDGVDVITRRYWISLA